MDASELPVDLYARPDPEDAALRALLARLGSESPRDLGGSMSLNLHLEQLGIVLRVHPRFETQNRLRALRDLRRQLARYGLTVGAPQTVLGHELVPVDGWLAEAETFIDAHRPPATWESYLWMFRAMGSLHHAVRTKAPNLELPSPEVATYGTPDELRRWMTATAAAVTADDEANALASKVQSMLGPLERQWTPAEHLPQQVIHGDIRLGNVAMTPDGGVAYFDFGFAARRPRIHDLAYALFWIVLKPDDSGTADSFDWRGAAELIEVYEASASEPLNDLERRSIGPYLAAVPMHLAAIASYTPDPCDRIKQEIRSLEIAQWVLNHPHEVDF